MNFSRKQSLRKFLSLVLVLTLAATTLTGCFGSSDSGETTGETSGLNINLSDPSDPSGTTAAPTETEAVEINENTATILSELTVRSNPSAEAFVVGTLYAGDRVEIDRREEVTNIDWAYIISPMSGWIMMDYVKMDIEPEDEAGSDTSTPAGNGTVTEPTQGSTNSGTGTSTGGGTTTNITGTITASTLNIRSEPSTTSGKIQGAYAKGDTVTILETKDGWGRTNKGWISMQYVSTSGSGTNTGTNSGTNTGTNTGTSTGNGSTTVQFKGIVTASELNIRSTASTEGTRVGSLSYGARVEILEKSGNWGRTKDGWISLDYVYQDGTTGSKTASGIVTGNQLNVRSGPGTGYGSVGSLNAGDRVSILEQFTYNGTTWGCIKNGWISLDYVYIDGTGTGNDKHGTITGDNLNIRSGPGTGYGSVGSLSSGEVVTILYQVTVGDTTWGNIDKGWISMDYVDLD